MIWEAIKSGRISKKEARNYLTKECARYTDKFEEMEGTSSDPTFVRALRNNQFMVQVYKEEFATRLSINKIAINKDGTRWKDGITWDEIQNIKNNAGYRNFCALEIYPPEDDKVDVANMRHIFVTSEEPLFLWKREKT